MTSSQYDFILFGATSFIGQILCKYMMSQYGNDGSVNWAVAGRSASKLETLRAELGPGAEDLPIIIADAKDESALKDMVSKTRVMISTVGPYAFFGEPLVKVCAQTGTDYCDLTGEAQWIRSMITKYEAQAKQSGARIVHCCGFDSIPSDLGVHYLQEQAKSRFGETCTEVKMGVKAMKGSLSGGTVASLINVVKEAAADPALRRELINPYSLCPPDHLFATKQKNINSAAFDADFKAWVAPFIMAAINSKVVHRTNALLGNAYGTNFKYQEAVLMKNGWKGRLSAIGLTAGITAFMTAAAIKPARKILETYVAPKPGEGPGPESRENGFYHLHFWGKTSSGKILKTQVTGDRDPGYGSTSKILAQAGLCLAKDLPKQDPPGGFWTPATAFGQILIDRLVKYAGLTFETIASS